MENNKAFTLINGDITLTNGDRASFFLLSPAFLANGSRVQKEHKELFYFDRVEKDVAPRVFSVKNCIRFPDKHVSNISKLINLKNYKLYRMKSSISFHMCVREI
jgi:hypothetical protein